MDVEVKQYTKKQVITRIIIVVLAIGVAAGAFVFAFVNIFKKESGWSKITPNSDQTVTGYTNLFSLNYYLDGSSSQNRAVNNDITNIYTDTLKKYYAYYDELKTYSQYPSIGLLNEKVGEDVTLIPEVYETLKTYYEISLSERNYSLFSAPIFRFWTSISVKSTQAEKEAADPLNNEDAKNEIEQLAAILNKPSSVVLEFKNDNVVKMTISDEYKAFRNYYEYTTATHPIVSLGNIKNALLMEKIIEALKNKNYHNGYITDYEGLSVTLKNTKDLQVYLYNYQLKDGQDIYTKYAYLKNDGELCDSSLRRFKMSTLNDGYTFLHQGQTILRSAAINLKTGYPNNFTTNINILKADTSITSRLLQNLDFATLDNYNDLVAKSKILGENIGIIFTINGEDKKVYANEYGKKFVTENEQMKYEWVTI